MSSSKQLTYPWLSEVFVNETLSLFNNSHALVVSGGKGVGKRALVEVICRHLLVENRSLQVRHLYEAGTHPDLHVLSSAYAWSELGACLQAYTPRYLDPVLIDKKRLSRQISVESVRLLCQNMSVSAAQGGKKIVLINLAEHLNSSSANALLKFLEEPNQDTFIILLTHDISQLSATIRSRCVRQHINLPPDKQTLLWLKMLFKEESTQTIENAFYLSAKRPLLAKQILLSNQQQLAADLLDDVLLVIGSQANIIELVRKWLKYKQSDFIFDWLIMLLSDLIKLSSVSNGKLELYNQANLVKIKTLCNAIDLPQAYSLYDNLCNLKKRYDGVSDEALLFEDILIQIQQRKRTAA